MVAIIEGKERIGIMGSHDEINISEMVGQEFESVEGSVGGETIRFTLPNGEGYRFEHDQDCCESVYVEDICGELSDLAGVPLLEAIEETSDTNPEGVQPEYQDSFTWTFYTFATIKGSVTIRWYGESNGYYGEEVDLHKF